MKEVIKKQLDNAPKRKDDEKIQMTQVIGLIRPVFLYSYDLNLCFCIFYFYILCEFLLNLDIVMKAKIVLYQSHLRK